MKTLSELTCLLERFEGTRHLLSHLHGDTTVLESRAQERPSDRDGALRSWLELEIFWDQCRSAQDGAGVLVLRLLAPQASRAQGVTACAQLAAHFGSPHVRFAYDPESLALVAVFQGSSAQFGAWRRLVLRRALALPMWSEFGANAAVRVAHSVSIGSRWGREDRFTAALANATARQRVQSTRSWRA